MKVKTAKVKVTVTKRLLVSDLDMFLEFPCSATVQSLYNSICLGSIGIDHVLNEPFYKGIVLQRNYKKMTQFHDQKIWEPQLNLFFTQILVITML